MILSGCLASIWYSVPSSEGESEGWCSSRDSQQCWSTSFPFGKFEWSKGKLQQCKFFNTLEILSGTFVLWIDVEIQHTVLAGNLGLSLSEKGLQPEGDFFWGGGRGRMRAMLVKNSEKNKQLLISVSIFYHSCCSMWIFQYLHVLTQNQVYCICIRSW